MISTPHAFEAEEIMAYLDGELAADRALAVGRHVEECSECRKLVAELRGVSQKLAGWEVEACGVRAIEERPAPRRWWTRRWVWAAGLAAAGVIAMFIQSPERFQRMDALRTVAPVPMLAPPQGQQGRAADFGTRLRSEFKIEPMIARAAQLSILATDFPHARERLEAILKAHHGYMGQLTVNAPAGAGRTLDAALKVPAPELDATLGELKKLGRVESESTTGEEVTQQYVDLEARLNNARNAEQRLTAVLRQQTAKMSDVLAVEKEITRVRGEIEQMEAERKTLSGRVEFATINVRLTEEYKAQFHAPDSVATRLGNAAVAGYRNFTGGVLGIVEWTLEYGLTIVVWCGVLFLPARFVWRRLRT